MLPSAFDDSDALAAADDVAEAVAGVEEEELSPKTDQRPLAMLTMSEPPPDDELWPLLV